MSRMNLEEVSIAILKEMQRSNDLKKMELMLAAMVAADSIPNISVLEMAANLKDI